MEKEKKLEKEAEISRLTEENKALQAEIGKLEPELSKEQQDNTRLEETAYVD